MSTCGSYQLRAAGQFRPHPDVQRPLRRSRLQPSVQHFIVCGMGKHDRLWARYWAIRDSHKNGYWMPILWHLALRRDSIAMTELSSTFAKIGRIADPFSQSGLAYRAYRAGSALGAQHLAMNAFNQRDLSGYRYWLGHAARLGDCDAKSEHSRFEIRLPHQNAALIGRKRPHRASDFE